MFLVKLEDLTTAINRCKKSIRAAKTFKDLDKCALQVENIKRVKVEGFYLIFMIIDELIQSLSMARLEKTEELFSKEYQKSVMTIHKRITNAKELQTQNKEGENV